jgi:glycosyltransferase involved in cell wall biosynthesis
MVTTFLGYEHDHLQHGGRPRIVRDLAYILRDLGFTVIIVQKGTQDHTVVLDANITVRKVRVPIRTWADVLFALRTRKVVESADVCCYASCEDGFPFFAKRAFGIQHGISWDKPTGSPLTRIVVNHLQFWRLAALCRAAARVICVDTNVINWLRMYGSAGHRAADKCVYLPNYLDAGMFTEPSRSLIEARFNNRHLIYLRRFEPVRGAVLFVEMCRTLRDRDFGFSASMIGWGSEKPLVLALIERYGLGDAIEVAEADLDAVPDRLRPASVAVVPTIYSEGTSLACIEAIGMGVPVVASDVGGLGNVMIPGFNGYVVKADAVQLANAVQAALCDRETYIRLATNCLRMRDVFSLEHWRERTIAILRESGVLSGNDAAPIHAGRSTGTVAGRL